MKMTFLRLFTFLLLGSTFNWVSAQNAVRDYEQGYAVYYADYFHGRKTANGELYDRSQFTCAHKTHPFGTLLRITRLDNSNTVVVRVNDRGPFGEGLVVDLSRVAAEKIDLLRDGKTRVRVEVIGVSPNNPANGVVQQTVSRQNPSAYNKVNNIPSQYDQPVSDNRRTNRTQGDLGLSESIKAALSGANNAPDQTPDAYETPASNPSGVPNVKLGSVVVQFGAYSNLDNAKRQMNMLTAKGIPNLYIVETRRSNKILNRIIMGPYESTGLAQSASDNLKKTHGVTSVVTKL